MDCAFAVENTSSCSVALGDSLDVIAFRMNHKPTIKTTASTLTPTQNSPRLVGADIAEPDSVVDGVEVGGGEKEVCPDMV